MVGLALGLGLGVGLGANFALVGAFGTKRVLAAMTSPERLSARERFLACTTAEDIPTHEELEQMLAQRQGRYATPPWPAP
jgi:threonine dehydrogenase-like Zn-dependent dehydrogenase